MLRAMRLFLDRLCIFSALVPADERRAPQNGFSLQEIAAHTEAVKRRSRY